MASIEGKMSDFSYHEVKKVNFHSSLLKYMKIGV